jgi:SPP1 gp7 family putative phage head morphogenesis protein
MATDASLLRALFDQPPEDAIAFLRSKGLRITFNWQEMLDEAHVRAFTVAKAMRLDVLRDIRGGLLDALSQGRTLRQFETDLTPLLQAKGWWGKQIVVDAQGQAQQVQLGSPCRLKTIYQTNLQSAYMAGRAQAQAQADAFPYLMYVAVMDGKTRPSHAALHGKVWRKDDPVWLVLFPPNGFNCRCRTRALTEGQMQREGLVLSPPPEILTRTVNAGSDQATGELFPTVQSGVRVTGADGRPVTMWVDSGFNSSPLAGHAFDELLARKAVAALGDAKGFEQVREAVLSDSRMKAWRSFVEGALHSGIANKAGRAVSQGQTMTVGILSLDLARSLATRGEVFSPVLYVEDSLLVGRKAGRHAVAGNALHADDWMVLPEQINGPDVAAYIDTRSGNLMLVWPGDESTAFKAAFNSAGKMDTAFRVAHESVHSDVEAGLWVPV